MALSHYFDGFQELFTIKIMVFFFLMSFESVFADTSGLLNNTPVDSCKPFNLANRQAFLL